MSEPIRKIKQTPESYTPKNKPEILSMMEGMRQIEKLVQTINYKGITFEIVQRPDVLWVGCLDYANNNAEESDSNKTLSRYQDYLDIVKQDLINPDWSASLWVNYGCDDKPRGQMFAQESYSANQDARYEVFTQPGGLWMRVRRKKETSLALFGNESIDAWDYFINGVLQNAAEENGYQVNPDVHVRIGYDCHAEYATPPHTCYAYMPIIEIPEGYSPKNKPVILEMVSEASVENQPKLKASASTIKAEERNKVRIIELPACKMVTSGPANGEDAFAPGECLMRFHEWFTEYDKQRTDQFYPRNFMWSPPGGGFQWGFAVDEIPADTNGLDVIDFPGGLYAVAISVDADGQDHDRVYNGILEWVNNSGCFVLDETDERRSLGNITSPPFVKDIIGYDQMDLYFPIAIKEESK